MDCVEDEMRGTAFFILLYILFRAVFIDLFQVQKV